MGVWFGALPILLLSPATSPSSPIWPALISLPLTGGTDRPIQYVPNDSAAVSITFDACATSTKAFGFDRGVFETLKREQIPATIFVSGRWAEKHADAMAELAADPLIEFGDHSYDHPHMRFLPPDQMALEIDTTEAVLARYGKRGVAFRPPYGEWSVAVLDLLRRRQMPVVLWDVISGDPSAKISAAGIVRNVLARTRPGSIIVFHINGRGWKTADALPSVISELRARGFRFVLLSELLAGRRTGVVAEPAASSVAAAAATAAAAQAAAEAFDPLVPAR